MPGVIARYPCNTCDIDPQLCSRGPTSSFGALFPTSTYTLSAQRTLQFAPAECTYDKEENFFEYRTVGLAGGNWQLVQRNEKRFPTFKKVVDPSDREQILSVSLLARWRAVNSRGHKYLNICKQFHRNITVTVFLQVR